MSNRRFYSWASTIDWVCCLVPFIEYRTALPLPPLERALLATWSMYLAYRSVGIAQERTPFPYSLKRKPCFIHKKSAHHVGERLRASPPKGLISRMTNLTQHKPKDPSISARVSNKWLNGRACEQAGLDFPERETMCHKRQKPSLSTRLSNKWRRGWGRTRPGLIGRRPT